MVGWSQKKDRLPELGFIITILFWLEKRTTAQQQEGTGSCQP
jgi:hypothetical protein